MMSRSWVSLACSPAGLPCAKTCVAPPRPIPSRWGRLRKGGVTAVDEGAVGARCVGGRASRDLTMAEVRLDEGKAASSSFATRAIRRFGCQRGWSRLNFIATAPR